MICLDDLVPEKMFPLVESTIQAWKASKT
jgi:hypothetical protein